MTIKKDALFYEKLSKNPASVGVTAIDGVQKATVDPNTVAGMFGLTGPQGALLGAGLSGIVGGITGKQQAKEEEAKFKAQGVQAVATVEANRNQFQTQILNNLSQTLTQALLK